ncbi:AraC family transcriptional regulator [Cystobacter fuscus]|uniref:AraC family transcriptional regulator n=1 Tax=Cystobacter fuscus TaxID=43 RepID=A0A250J1K3_9BACT|nr:helix-turn-helix domain-containing protein [Cystobacter fuscus]ATB37046.1 AraC family transcriptional regulator [Cystobacter fuscus]
MPSRHRTRTLPSAPSRIADAGASLAARCVFRQREMDHVFLGVTWLSPGIVHVTRGQKLIRADGTDLQVDAGGYVWIPAGAQLDVRNVPHEGEYAAEALVLSPQLARWLPPQPVKNTPQELRRLSTTGNAEVVEAWHRCTRGLADGAPQEVLRHRLLELLAWLGELGIDAFGASGSVRLRVKRLFSETPGKPWRLGDVARQLAMSEDTLQRHLTRDRASFQELLGEVRMEHALFLLWTTERPLGLIAEDVGYLSASRFAARFRKRFGVLPSELRKGR